MPAAAAITAITVDVGYCRKLRFRSREKKEIDRTAHAGRCLANAYMEELAGGQGAGSGLGLRLAPHVPARAPIRTIIPVAHTAPPNVFSKTWHPTHTHTA